MDLEWLLPEQIEQILRFCQLSAVQDLTLAANILQDHNWNIENALNDIVTQNDEAKKQEARKQQKTNHLAPAKQELNEWAHHESNHQSDQFELDQANYQELVDYKPEYEKGHLSQHSSILAQQNFEYEQMGRKMKQQKEEEAQLKEYHEMREKEFEEGQKEFKNRKTTSDFTIKFRLTHGTKQYNFSKKDKIETVLRYVNCCLRDNFDNRYSDFNLTQSHPPVSLLARKNETLEEVFEDSLGEVLIVRELD